MKVCIPVSEFRGLDSPVFGRFGSAPCFALADTETLAVEQVSNRDEHHVHRAPPGTVGEALRAFQSGGTEELNTAPSCPGHAHGCGAH